MVSVVQLPKVQVKATSRPKELDSLRVYFT